MQPCIQREVVNKSLKNVDGIRLAKASDNRFLTILYEMALVMTRKFEKISQENI